MRTETLTLIDELELETDGNPKVMQSATPAFAGTDCKGSSAAISVSTVKTRLIGQTLLDLVEVQRCRAYLYPVIN